MVDVYLDAVFFPKCVEDFQTFQQEGWHYELNDPSEEISYKGFTVNLKHLYVDLAFLVGFSYDFLPIDVWLSSGVVFNEMKGVYSQPDNLLGRISQQVSLFLFSMN